ncbi:MAG: (d)CMP kinase [Myxococcota bacterium]|nr:(d)CMP kinase [Myxococcota bacterium]
MSNVSHPKHLEGGGGLVVAVDGPAGAGKSTLAKLCARDLGYTYIDTGAMYRAVGLLARRAAIDFEDERGLAELVAGLDFQFQWVGEELHTVVAGEDISGEIRTPQAAMDASTVSKVGDVREALVALQRRMGAAGGVVMEGRDIGTVVFPEADLKIFLTASPTVRAQRRLTQMEERGQEGDLATIIEEIRKRDLQDRTRDISPLRPAEDAVELDSSELGIDSVVAIVGRLVRERRALL